MKFIKISALTALLLILSGCEKSPVELTTVSFVNNDKGSGHFDRMLEICFTEPLSSDYFYEVTIITHQAFKLQGSGKLKASASNPNKKKCIDKNIYHYATNKSPTGTLDIIKDYMTAGNINQLLIKIYNEKPAGKQRPIAERLFKNL